MKALTLHQPWASLVALGVKTIETRSWPAPAGLIGQRLAIHAGASTAGIDSICAGEEAGWRYCYLGPEGEFQAAYCFRTSDEGRRGQTLLQGPGIAIEDEYSALLRGAVVATAVLTDCVPIVTPDSDHRGACVEVDGAVLTQWSAPDYWSNEQNERDVTDQLPYGDFTPGWYAWLLGDVKPTTERCPACWGEGGSWDAGCAYPCPTCDGAGGCPPVPVKGRQRLWNWEP